MLAEELNGGRRVWLLLLTLTASAAQVAVTLEQQSRYALGVPGLARAIGSGVDGSFVFVAFAAPPTGSVAEAQREAWSLRRVAALTRRIAGALAPLHDQGIAHGALRPELVSESEHGEVVFGFGVAALATRFGAPGEASQWLAPSYRAPELRSALLPPTPASDVYALGELVRTLLSGPDSAAAKGMGSSGAARQTAAVEALLARALAPDPRARIADARAFAAELVQIAPSEELAGANASGSAGVALELRAETARDVPEPFVPAPSVPFAPGVSDVDALNVAAPSAPLAITADSGAPLPSAAGSVEPLPAPPAAAHGVGFVPAPTYSARDSSRATAITLALVIGGFLLMVGGVIGATTFAIRHARPSALSRHAPGRRLPPHPALPSPAFPPPSEEESPPAPSAETAPAKPRLAISHAPLLPPGVGPSAFPEEARAVLPVLGSEPIWGTRHAPLTWVVFGDLECPYTRHLFRSLEAAKTTFGDDLRIVFRHRPLREHPYAPTAARALAGLAKTRGSAAFFAVLHQIAQDDTSLSDERLQALFGAAGYANLDPLELARAGESSVLSDLQLAGQFAVRSTPLSFLNGTRVEGERSSSEVERLLLDEHRSAAWALAAGAPAKDLYATRTSDNLIGVGAEEPSRSCAPVASSPARGPADALVTLVEFSDFECDYCKQVEPTLKTLLARYPKTLRLIWKDYPAPQHKEARLLANFAAAAGSRGAGTGFWAVHDALFTRAGGVDDGALSELAGKAGLDGVPLLFAAHAGAYDAAIHADIALGERLGVRSLPTFFANGRRIEGALPLEQFDALIRTELSSAERIVAHGVPRDKVYRLVCDGSD